MPSKRPRHALRIVVVLLVLLVIGGVTFAGIRFLQGHADDGSTDSADRDRLESYVSGDWAPRDSPGGAWTLELPTSVQPDDSWAVQLPNGGTKDMPAVAAAPGDRSRVGVFVIEADLTAELGSDWEVSHRTSADSLVNNIEGGRVDSLSISPTASGDAAFFTGHSDTLKVEIEGYDVQLGNQTIDVLIVHQHDDAGLAALTMQRIAGSVRHK